MAEFPEVCAESEALREDDVDEVAYRIPYSPAGEFTRYSVDALTSEIVIMLLKGFR